MFDTPEGASMPLGKRERLGLPTTLIPEFAVEEMRRVQPYNQRVFSSMVFAGHERKHRSPE
jgi:hypothetical protein